MYCEYTHMFFLLYVWKFIKLNLEYQFVKIWKSMKGFNRKTLDDSFAIWTRLGSACAPFSASWCPLFRTETYTERAQGPTKINITSKIIIL
jgi:hypothetical protein